MKKLLISERKYTDTVPPYNVKHILTVSLCAGVIDLSVINNQSKEQNLVVGVFISRKHAQDLITLSPEFVSSHRYIRYIELAKANQAVNVTLYFFANDQVSFENKYVTGIYYHAQEDAWLKKRFPLPDLLYDRGGGTGRKSIWIIKKFRKLGIRNINALHYFDKWDLYDRLSKVDAVSSHLPVTVKGEHPIYVWQMLNQYGHVYLKTRRGSCGLGVIRIEKQSPDRFRYYYSCGGQLSSEVFTKQDLTRILDHFFSRTPFIIQKPIDLMKKGDRIIDFRSEVQKNGKGQLSITGTTVRIGRPLSPIASNTCREDYYRLDEFVKKELQLNAKDAAALQKKIHHFLFTVFRAAEHVYGSFGEIGIDFGLDTEGHLWLIECNSKSARVALYNAYGRQKVRQSFQNLLQYAKYLAARQQ